MPRHPIGILLACASVLTACASDPARLDSGEVEGRQDVEQRPDEVILDNGDRLTGTITYLSPERVGVLTGYAGVIDVDWRSVRGLTSYSTISVWMANGELHRGRVSMDAEGRILMRISPDQEPLVINRMDIRGSTRLEPDPVKQAIAPQDEYRDLVVLENGDRISGILEGKPNRRVIIETRHSDVIQVRWTRVVELETQYPIQVSLTDGRVAVGRLDLNQDGFLTVYIEGEEPLRVHRDQVSRLDRRRSRLEGDIVASLNATKGNTDNLSSLVKWDLMWKGLTDTITFKGNSSFASVNNSTTDENLYSQLRYDYLFLAGTYVFASGELSHDEFENVKLSTTYTLGGGYEIVEKNWLELTADFGLAYTRQNFDQPGGSDFVGGRAGLRFKWHLPLEFEIRETFTYFPSFEDSADWRIRNEFVLDRSVYRGWRFQTGFITNYTNVPQGDAKSGSNTIYFGLGYRF